MLQEDTRIVFSVEQVFRVQVSVQVALLPVEFWDRYLGG